MGTDSFSFSSNNETGWKIDYMREITRRSIICAWTKISWKWISKGNQVCDANCSDGLNPTKPLRHDDIELNETIFFETIHETDGGYELSDSVEVKVKYADKNRKTENFPVR